MSVLQVYMQTLCNINVPNANNYILYDFSELHLSFLESVLGRLCTQKDGDKYLEIKSLIPQINRYLQERDNILYKRRRSECFADIASDLNRSRSTDLLNGLSSSPRETSPTTASNISYLVSPAPPIMKNNHISAVLTANIAQKLSLRHKRKKELIY